MNDKVLGVILGDPAGVGPEIVSKTLSKFSNGIQNKVVIIGGENSLVRGMEITNSKFHYSIVSDPESILKSTSPIVIYNDEGFENPNTKPGIMDVDNGKCMINMLKASIDLFHMNIIQGIVYAPLNKNAINLANEEYSDELEVFRRYSNFHGLALEMNYASNLWTTRVTGHIPLMDISKHLTIDRILDVVRLTNSSLVKFGINNPKLFVCALNPHGGERGLFGDEEIKIISPAVALATAEGINIEGPFPADTVFHKAFSGECDAVVTMYHDQGQIALKTKSFSEGVTFLAGLPFIVTTAGHGVGYDIAHKGIANEAALENAISIALKFINS